MAAAQTARVLAPASARGGNYERHRPEETVLYQTLQAHWHTFLAEVSGESATELPRFVIEEVEAFLKCAIPGAWVPARRLRQVQENRLVAFSCKRRGFCSSCLSRRMCDFEAHLRDHVMPNVPVRKWVLTVPRGLRFRMAFNPDVTGMVLRTFVSVVSRWLRRRARASGIRGLLKTGGVTVIQRFGSALNLNVHFHTLMIDGVYELRRGGPPICSPSCSTSGPERGKNDRRSIRTSPRGLVEQRRARFTNSVAALGAALSADGVLCKLDGVSC